MRDIWEHVIKSELAMDPKSINVLMSDSPLNTKDKKQAMAKELFDEMKINSLSIFNSAVLSLFSTGRTSGIVVESGQGVTYTVPIFEGYALPHAIQRLDVAGQDVTNHLIENLIEQGCIEKQNSGNYVQFVREMKEQMCSVAYNYEEAINSPDPLSEEECSYELPDGKGIIEVDHKTRYSATEILFRPKMCGVDGAGVAELAYKSIEKCDQDLKIVRYL